MRTRWLILAAFLAGPGAPARAQGGAPLDLKPSEAGRQAEDLLRDLQREQLSGGDRGEARPPPPAVRTGSDAASNGSVKRPAQRMRARPTTEAGRKRSGNRGTRDAKIPKGICVGCSR
ncbi:hypothetical protein [Methylobacterium nigriterrae]|uniref:hypothetical protein n=1 Tax=Methylobacterium nigriterrae TaxID=3127512 RepID=UPI003013C5A4